MTAVPDWDIASPRDTDAELVRAVLGGDRSAFAQMYDRYADRLYDFCVGMLRDRDGAADCVQDSFCIAADRLTQLREPDKLRPWLYSIARNEVQRRFRERRRETPSEELPDDTSEEPGPETLAARTELADLIADAAGGLSDRDQTVLELAYRHGLDGPELAQALGVSQTNANTMVGRLRDTIERSLGALLVARRVRSNPAQCAELAALLDGWDGHFNVLMRKRVARHIESCPVCDDVRHSMVSPTALLGATPIFIKAPDWLRHKTIDEVQLVPHETEAGSPPVGDAGRRRNTRRWVLSALVLTALLGAPLGLTALWPTEGPVGITPTDVNDSVPEPPLAPPTQSTPSFQTGSAAITATSPPSPAMKTATVTTTMPEASPPSNPPQIDEPTPVTITSVPPMRTSSAPTESSSRPTLSSRVERTRIEVSLPRSQPTRRAVNPPPNRAPAPDPIR